MRRLIYLTLTGIICFTCQSEQKKEVLSFEEIAGETGIESADTEEIDRSFTMLDSSINGQFAHAMCHEFDSDSATDFHVFDRYTSNYSRKMFFKQKMVDPGSTNEVGPSVCLFYYTFEDSIKTNNAFYNYLDELSMAASNPIQIGKNTDKVMAPPQYMLVYDTVIVSAKYKQEIAYNWGSFQDSMKVYYGKTPRYELELQDEGTLNWK